MPKETSRTRKVGELIQRELATLLMQNVKDPRFAMVSITAVKVSRDMGIAKIYFTIIHKDQDLEPDLINQTLQALKKAAGYFRFELGQSIKLRTIPRLDFCYDDSIIHGARLTRLIDDVIADDKNKQITSPSSIDEDKSE